MVGMVIKGADSAIYGEDSLVPRLQGRSLGTRLR